MTNTTTTAIRALGVTAHLTPMTETELEDWTFVTDYLHGRGPIRAYTVTHPDRGELGLILTKGRDCHAEWLNPQAGEYLYAGRGRTLQYALAAILNAHESNGHPVTPAIEREAAGAPTPKPLAPKVVAEAHAEEEAASAVLAASAGRGVTGVVYHGRHTSLQHAWLIATPCGTADGRCPCRGFELFNRAGVGLAEHVRARHLQVTLDQDLWHELGV